MMNRRCFSPVGDASNDVAHAAIVGPCDIIRTDTQPQSNN